MYVCLGILQAFDANFRAVYAPSQYSDFLRPPISQGHVQCEGVRVCQVLKVLDPWGQYIFDAF